MKGYVESGTTMVYEIFRELRRELNDLPQKRVTLLVHPDVAALLYDEERQGIEEIEEYYGREIVINPRPGFHLEQYEIAVG